MDDGAHATTDKEKRCGVQTLASSAGLKVSSPLREAFRTMASCHHRLCPAVSSTASRLASSPGPRDVGQTERELTAPRVWSSLAVRVAGLVSIA